MNKQILVLLVCLGCSSTKPIVKPPLKKQDNTRVYSCSFHDPNSEIDLWINVRIKVEGKLTDFSNKFRHNNVSTHLVQNCAESYVQDL